MESDLAPGEKCAMGGEATVSSDDRLWGASWTVDEILRRFFEFNYLSKDGTERYVLRKEFALRLACADIADLLRHHLQVERAGSFGSLVVIREAPENVPRDALDRNEAS
jgi:hypothetical protein